MNEKGSAALCGCAGESECLFSSNEALEGSSGCQIFCVSQGSGTSSRATVGSSIFALSLKGIPGECPQSFQILF